MLVHCFFLITILASLCCLTLIFKCVYHTYFCKIRFYFFNFIRWWFPWITASLRRLRIPIEIKIIKGRRIQFIFVCNKSLIKTKHSLYLFKISTLKIKCCIMYILASVFFEKEDKSYF